jgi:hypothetical protein
VTDIETILKRLDDMDRQRLEARREHRSEQKRVEDGIRDLTVVMNGRITQIEIKMAGDAAVREKVAHDAAELRAAKEVRQKSFGWKVGVIASACAGIAALTTAASIIGQLIVH